MHALTVALATALLLSGKPSDPRAHWYARQVSDTRYGGCQQAEDSLDDVLAHVSAGWARASQGRGKACTVLRSGPEASVGFAVDCGEGGVHLFFRSEAQCALFVSTINAGRRANPEDYVPPGAKSRSTWLTTYGQCMESWVHAETVRRRALQVTATMCECLAGELAASAAAPTEARVKAAGSACLAAVPASEKAKLAPPRSR
ncbi:conserved hypothetical protein [Anaeromyxobacter sp. K]|uniref:hypothetical protein n=1 Tax=Anaeromyxobacter sp. (strain K) TaxID=447217 RepID=UPI00015F8A66|nr:hypothetical protein [Anaeromyxobacter sp. K]ACG74188.1 conserved hypothetical protein [Anaeromyxobacter sp. K]